MDLNEQLRDAVEIIGRDFARESADWELVRRNRAIAARNRFLAEHGEWLGLDWSPMPLEVVNAN